MTDTATLSATRVGIARPNATNVFVSSQFGLLMVSHCSANVSSIPGATTVQVNLPDNHPDFQVGTEYIVGGQLSDPPAEYIEPFVLKNAVFKGYGTGLLQNVGVFVGMIVKPE